MRFRFLFIVNFLGFFFSNVYAQAADHTAKKITPNVAVVPFSGDQNVTPEQLSFITSRFTGDLIATNSFTVLDRSKMDFILKEQGFQQTGACNSSECKVQMGQLLGVDNLVVGNMVRFGKTYALHLDYVDVGSGQIVKTVEAEQKGDLEDVYKEICRVGVENLVAALSNKSLDSQARVIPTDALPKLHANAMSGKHKIALALLGTSLLSAGGGVYFNAKASSDMTDYNRAKDLWQNTNSQSEALATTLTDSYNNEIRATKYRNVCYGVSLTALIAGAVLWFWPEEK